MTASEASLDQPEQPIEHQRLRMVVESQLSSFPEAMDHLVVAGLFDRDGAMRASSRNTYVVPGQARAFDYVHAEQALLRSLESDRLPEGEYELVVSLEPCDERDEGESCASRIVTVAERLGIKRLVAGCLDDGRGIPLLAQAGIEVEVLIGERLEGPEGRNLNARVLGELRRAMDSNAWGKRVRLTAMPAADAVNAESNRRQRTKLERLEERTEEVLAWIGSRSPTPELILGRFPDVFSERDVVVLAELIDAARAAPSSMQAIFRPTVQRRAWQSLNRARDLSIMEHELRSGGSCAGR